MKNKILDAIGAEQLLKENRSFCSAPWIQTHTWPDGRVFPCCMSNYQASMGTVSTDTKFITVWNGDDYKKLRQDMISGIPRPDVCSRCYEQEQHFGRSSRTELTTSYWKEIKQQLLLTEEDGTSPMDLIYWDYRFNNICNLSCRTCGPDLSSSWYDDHVKQYGVSPKFQKTKFTIFDSTKDGSVHQELIENQIDKVKEIYFAGGEPILMPEHQDIIHRLIEHGRTDVILRYSTNLTTLTYKGTKFLDLWPTFKKVMLFISLDEIGKRAEYWRNGTNWIRLESNMKIVRAVSRQHTNFQIGFAPTISIFNIHRLDIYMQYLIDNDLIDQRTPFSYNVLSGPMAYNIKIMPLKYKQRANESLDRLEKLVGTWSHHSNNIKSVRNWLNDSVENPEKHLEYGAKQFATLDKIREQNLEEIAPDIYEIYKDFNYNDYFNSFTPR